MSDPIMVYIGMPLIKGIVILGVLLLTVAYLTFAERKFLGYMQVRLGPNRVGPKGWLQPIADGLKLFTKEDLVPGRAERFVFMLAPILIFAPAILVWAVIPFGESFTIGGVEIQPFLADINIAVLFVLAVSTIGVYGIILGGWASNNKFSLMGGLRSAAQMVSYEVPMGFAVVSVLLMAGTLSLVGIVEAQRDFGLWFIFPGILGFGIYFVCGVAETNRNPFDLPEAEAELVAGFHTGVLLPRRVRQHAGGLVARGDPFLRRLAAAVPERGVPRLPRPGSGVLLVFRQGAGLYLCLHLVSRHLPALPFRPAHADRLEVAVAAVAGQRGAGGSRRPAPEGMSQ